MQPDLIDQLLADYQKPEDLIGESEILTISRLHKITETLGEMPALTQLAIIY